VFTEHPPLKLTDVFAAMLPALKFQPALHVQLSGVGVTHQGRPAQDEGLPKEFGGSGATLPGIALRTRTFIS